MRSLHYKDLSIPTFVWFMAHLIANICNQDRLVLSNIGIDIILWPTRNDFGPISHLGGTELKICIKDIKLYMFKIDVCFVDMLGHDAAFEISWAMYPFQSSDVQTYDIPDRTYRDILEDIFQWKISKHLVIGMVVRSLFGQFLQNSSVFKHFKKVSLWFYVNGEATARQAFKLEFTSCNYL